MGSCRHLSTQFRTPRQTTHLAYPHFGIVCLRLILQLGLPHHVPWLAIGVLTPDREFPEDFQVYGRGVCQVA